MAVLLGIIGILLCMAALWVMIAAIILNIVGILVAALFTGALGGLLIYIGFEY